MCLCVVTARQMVHVKIIINIKEKSNDVHTQCTMSIIELTMHIFRVRVRVWIRNEIHTHYKLQSRLLMIVVALCIIYHVPFLYFLVHRSVHMVWHRKRHFTNTFGVKKSIPIKEFCLRWLVCFSSTLDFIWVLECEETQFIFNVQVQVLLLDVGSMPQCHSYIKSLHVAIAITTMVLLSINNCLCLSYFTVILYIDTLQMNE